MQIFKNRRGRFYRMNTALVVLSSLYAIGAVVALSSPYWATSYPVLAPLVAFAATPLGMGVLAAITVTLVGLAVCAIIENNRIYVGKAPRLVARDGQVMLQVTRGMFEEIKKNRVEDEEGKEIKGKHYMDFSLDNKDYRAVVGDEYTQELGGALFFKVDALTSKDSDGKYTSNSMGEIRKKLDEKESACVGTYLGELSSVASVQEGKGKQ